MKQMKFLVMLCICFILFTCIPTHILKDDTVKKYIITFDWSSELDTILRFAEGFGIKVNRNLWLINGFTFYATEAQMKYAKDTLNNFRIRYVIEDTVVTLITPKEEVNIEEYDDEIIDWGHKLIEAEKAWEAGYTGKNITIGIIDTGVNSKHPDLINEDGTSAVIGGINVIDNTSYEDDNNHGTYVATVLAARKNNRGIIGVAPNANIYAVKCMDNNGRGYTSDIITAYQAALERHKKDNTFKLVNLSIGTMLPTPALEEAVEQASLQGMGTVCAAGNSNTEPLYPANFNYPIAVGACGMNKQRTSWSNYGNKMLTNGVLAPGDWILAGTKNNSWTRVSGTSIATPFVTGTLALLIEGGYGIRKFIYEAASNYPRPTIYEGYGIINTYKSLITAKMIQPKTYNTTQLKEVNPSANKK